MTLTARDKILRSLRKKLKELEINDKNTHNLKDAIDNIMKYLIEQEKLKQNNKERILCAKKHINAILKDIN